MWQCSKPCHQETYDNGTVVHWMAAEQQDMRVPSALIPRCDRPMTMNLRLDDRFVEDAGWHTAVRRYSDFLCRYEDASVRSGG